LARRSFLRNTLEYWAAAFVIGSLKHAPLGIARPLARGYCRTLDLAQPRLRRVAMRNLALAMPEKTLNQHKRIADGVFRSLARLLVTFAKFPGLRREDADRWVRCEGSEHLEAAQRLGRGVLFATAHLGDWELGALAHAVRFGPMQVVARPLDNPRIDRLVARRRTSLGNVVIEKREAARPILKALSANQAVGILIDQNTTPDQGTFVDFFGTPACAGTGFAKIAAHSGAVVLPAFVFWLEEEKRYVLRYYPPVEMTGQPEEDTRRLHKGLETLIRQYPDQWLWIHRRWKTRPPGEPAIYG